MGFGPNIQGGYLSREHSFRPARDAQTTNFSPAAPFHVPTRHFSSAPPTKPEIFRFALTLLFFLTKFARFPLRRAFSAGPPPPPGKILANTPPCI